MVICRHFPRAFNRMRPETTDIVTAVLQGRGLPALALGGGAVWLSLLLGTPASPGSPTARLASGAGALALTVACGFVLVGAPESLLPAFLQGMPELAVLLGLGGGGVLGPFAAAAVVRRHGGGATTRTFTWLGLALLLLTLGLERPHMVGMIGAIALLADTMTRPSGDGV